MESRGERSKGRNLCVGKLCVGARKKLGDGRLGGN